MAGKWEDVPPSAQCNAYRTLLERKFLDLRHEISAACSTALEIHLGPRLVDCLLESLNGKLDHVESVKEGMPSWKTNYLGARARFVELGTLPGRRVVELAPGHSGEFVSQFPLAAYPKRLSKTRMLSDNSIDRNLAGCTTLENEDSPLKLILEDDFQQKLTHAEAAPQLKHADSQVSAGGEAREATMFPHPNWDRQPTQGSDAASTATFHSGMSVNKIVLDTAWAKLEDNTGSKRAKYWQPVPDSFNDSSTTHNSLMSFRSGDVMGDHKHVILRRLVISPGSPISILWSSMTMLAMVHDIIMTPLITFGIEGSEVVDALAVFSLVIWICDIPASFLCGFFDSATGAVEMRPRKTALHYLKAWFPFDICMVTLDLVSIFFTWLQAFGAFRLIRLTRLLRMVRCAKMQRMAVTNLNEASWFVRLIVLVRASEALTSFVNIFQNLLVIVVFNHFVACGWYSVGVIAENDFKKNWLQASLPRHRSFSYSYASAFHWSITQFTPASTDVHAHNELERGYSSFVILMGLVMFSYFVGNMSQNIAYLRNTHAHENRQRELVQQYIVEHRLSINLASDILHSINYRVAGGSRLQQQDIEAFQRLPKSLVGELRDEAFTPLICTHALFCFLEASDRDILSQISRMAVSGQSLTCNDEAFAVGARAEFMYFVTRGRMLYSLYGVRKPTEVLCPEYLAEIALWTPWEHCGRLTGSLAGGEVLLLNVATFQKIACDSLSRSLLLAYANVYILILKKDAKNGISNSDLCNKADDVLKRMNAGKRSGCMFSITSIFAAETDSLSYVIAGWKEIADEQKRARRASKRRFCGSCIGAAKRK